MEINPRHTPIIIIGPTAIGKSQIAIDVAIENNCEIISMDSVMIYSYFNIGSSKPTSAQRKLVPHHLIDILEPHQPYSVGQFLIDVNKKIKEVQSRGKTPLIVGGTYMYANALMTPTVSVETITDHGVRDYYNNKLMSNGLEALWHELVKQDARYLNKISPNDTQRILRALEVLKSTGKSLLDHWKEAATAPMATIKVVKIIPTDREALKNTIQRRFNLMLEEGLVDEVKSLLSMNGSNSFKALKSIGYRQVVSFIHKNCSYDDMIEKAVISTRQYAKRQLTWLRNNHYHQEFNIKTASSEEIMLKINKVLDNTFES
ncbi:MAG TPA: tRNA (adenosine(37)-N6)-dimethylallyltransferase MiaA [Gammaproteobacteria bacterium]|nr:tRNA (adenosine(37)-N6)-dimethylallyltransferase MiaA [Gammaproteobacteria bacterium]